MEIIDKIKNDKYYNSLLENGKSVEEIFKSGFFEDSTTESYDLKSSLRYLCTPISMIEKDYSAIFIMTGSFAPYHDGHHSLMKAAQKYLINLGYKNVYGYVAPDSDQYVIDKKIKDSAYSAENRIACIQEFIKDSPFRVDPWMALFRKEDINFTEYVTRMELYIEYYLGVKIPIYFICGGDNANFWRAFEFQGRCLVFDRKCQNSKFRSEKTYFKETQIENNRIHFIDFDHSESSTNVRENSFSFKEKAHMLQVRYQSNSSISGNPEKLEDNITNLLSQNFQFSYPTDISYQLKIMSYNFFLHRNKNLISLDSQIDLRYNLRVSRVYEIFGLNKLYYTVDESKSKLPADLDAEYTLFDDDVMTCGTMFWAKDYLRDKGYKISEKHLSFIESKISGDTEILDARDFVIGGVNNGLMVELPNKKISRVPYIYPFVSCNIRGSIKDGIKFSIEVFKLNMNSVDKDTYINKSSEQYEFWKSINMEELPIKMICQHWIKELKKLL